MEGLNVTHKAAQRIGGKKWLYSSSNHSLPLQGYNSNIDGIKKHKSHYRPIVDWELTAELEKISFKCGLALILQLNRHLPFRKLFALALSLYLFLFPK